MYQYIFSLIAPFVEIFKNWYTFLLIFFIFQYKKSENSNARIFWGNGHVRKDGRTNGGESKGPSTPSRDQKSDNSDEPIQRKVGKTSQRLRGIKGD